MTGEQELQGLANGYRLAAQLLRHELTEELVAALLERGVLQELEESGYQLDSGRLSDPEFLQQLRSEYARVFLGPGPHVSPYGSVHHPDDSKKGRLWGDSTIWVRRFAKDHGVDFAGKSYDGIPDHIGHVLELYALLVESELALHSSGDDDKVKRLNNSQRLLLEAQLTRWVPSFCDKVREAAELPFYGELARLTQDLVALEADRHSVGKAGIEEEASAEAVQDCP